MTFEDFEKTIEGMLAVQRQLQEDQLKLQESQKNHEGVISSLLTFSQQQQQTLGQLLTYSQQQQQTLDRLISYAFKNESDHLTIDERLSRLESRNGN